MARIDPKIFGALHVGGRRIAMGQHEACGPVSQRRLADALRATDQPCVGNAPAAIGVQERRLGLPMPEQDTGFTRLGDHHILLGLSRAHEVTGVGVAAVGVAEVAIVNKWSRTAVQTWVATVSGSAEASI